MTLSRSLLFSLFPLHSFPPLTPQDVITPTDVSPRSYDKSKQKLHNSGGKIADYLKQSMHVISTSRPSQTNSILSFFSPSLLFPNWYGIHGWSATVISVSLFFSQHVTFAGSGSQTAELLPRMESSFIAHRSPEETIDANLLMTLLWRLLKHQQRGRKHLLQGELLDCSQPGLNSSAILLGKDVDAMS